MSLEERISEQTEALKANTLAIKELSAGLAITGAIGKTTPEKGTTTQAGAPSGSSKAKGAGAGSTAPSGKEPTAADKKVVSSLVLELVAGGQRDKVKAILGKFGAAKVPELKDDKAVKGAHKALLALKAELAAPKAEEDDDLGDDDLGGDADEELDDLDDLDD